MWVLADKVVEDDFLLKYGMELGIEDEVMWGELAGRHELPLVVKPSDGGDELVWVRADLCMEGERSLVAANMDSWLVLAAGVRQEKSAVGRVLDEIDRDDDGDSDGGEEPPDERHVRREAGAMILVPRERIERAVELFGEIAHRELTASECLDLPTVLAAAEAMKDRKSGG